MIQQRAATTAASHAQTQAVVPALALRRTLLARGPGRYSRADLRADALAALVTAVVALPLNIALAIALGLRPEAGIASAIVAGVVAPLLGGSRHQITGPTAVLVVILTPVSLQYGLAGLAVASMGAGLILMAMALLRLGRFIEFIPLPVTTAFTAGIGVTIALLQVKDFFGLTALSGPPPTDFIARCASLAQGLQAKFGLAIATPSWSTFDELAIALLTLVVLVLWPRLKTHVPGPLVALPIAALAAWLGQRTLSGFAVDTIASRFGTPAAPHGIPRWVLTLKWPWNEPGPIVDGVARAFDLGTNQAVTTLLSTCFGIAMLGAIATLLSAVVADGLTGKRHEPNTELFGLGVANMLTPLIGGFAVTGAIARTVTSIRAGATSPLACVLHAALLGAGVLAAAPAIGTLPMAAMAALLVFVARGMIQTDQLAFLLRHAPRADAMVLVICLALTVLVDMPTAVSAGVVLAAMLFMQRMAASSRLVLVGAEHPAFSQPVPKGLVIYDVGGPLFFGAAGRAMATLEQVGTGVRAVILDMTDVPQIDATALVSLDAVATRLAQRGTLVVLAGARGDVLATINRAGWLARDGLLVVGSVEAGVEVCRAALE